MVVLTTYHTLVEKDAEKVGMKWKGPVFPVIIIILLIIGVASCIVSSLMLHTIVASFNNRCILNSNLSFGFKITPQNNLDNITSASASASASSSDLVNLRSFSPGVFDIKEATGITQRQLDFLSTKKIVESNSRWGKSTECDYGEFIPLFEACFGIVMTTFFLICGQGGKSKIQSLLPQPWRIVLPSTIFFFLMMVVAIVHIVFLLDGTKSFCESFLENMPDLSCSLAMNNFVLVEDPQRIMYPGTAYLLLKVSIWMTMTCWAISFLTMLCRIIFVADFELVRVTVRTKDEPAKKSSEYTVVQQSNDDESVSSGSQDYYSLEPLADEISTDKI